MQTRFDDATALLPLRLCLLPDGGTIELSTSAAVVGRHSDAELRLPHPDVSRRHCRFVFAAGQWRVEDLDSLNGVYVNGERVQEAALSEGDQLRIGTATLVVRAAPTAKVWRSIAAALTPLAG